ncbi:hypothetical protein FR943_06830 [Mycobacterium sp. TNTM28]|uniref:DUF2336 domain-containing protein n=1 Tax=[Mycobacterium] fortunisiensis TaxID=2600579 RepID=A0ABS6KJ21_9MYCO|nr:hypothetical protein [[Mycobacterium] fortunisiensis]MBU9763555.1 hypothetical protein [[Mycobacterium] fortunisiensis]
MGDKRRERKAKQARRDVRRAKKRDLESRPDTTFKDAILKVGKGRHPLSLLAIAGYLIHRTKPDPLAWPKVEPDAGFLDRFVAGMIGERNRETTELLAVLTELLLDDPELALRCREAVSKRDDSLPQWITALPQIEVYRAVRVADVLGDADELMIGARLNDQYELTAAVLIDHNALSDVIDAAVVFEPIDKVLARAAESSGDTYVVEMTPADARTWIEDALAESTFTRVTESWPQSQPLIQWLVGQLPEGGAHRPPTDWMAAGQLCDRFFATDAAAPFADPGHRDLLLALFETGCGDPLRWSEIRVERTIGSPCLDDVYGPLEIVLDAPDLLRAFIPYAHAQSGIHDDLTARTIATIDKLRSSYKRAILRQAERWDLDDAG